jgi:hypothetical protein
MKRKDREELIRKLEIVKSKIRTFEGPFLCPLVTKAGIDSKWFKDQRPGPHNHVKFFTHPLGGGILCWWRYHGNKDGALKVREEFIQHLIDGLETKQYYYDIIHRFILRIVNVVSNRNSRP